MLLKLMSINNKVCILENYTIYGSTLCGFRKNLSGHFARFACNHSYGYASRRIEQIDSLRFHPNSTFL